MLKANTLIIPTMLPTMLQANTLIIPTLLLSTLTDRPYNAASQHLDHL